MNAYARRLVALVTLAVFINYVDRGNLSTAAPLIGQDLGLTPSELGLLFSAFYWGYVPLMPATGWVAERFGSKVVLGVGLAIWSIATVLTGAASSFASLVLLRVLLGVGESVAFPCASGIFAATLSVEHLGIANGIMSFGYLLGPAIGTFAGGFLMSAVGWRPVFLIFGLVSLCWLVLWRRTPVPRATLQLAGEQSPGLLDILGRRALWGTCLGHFSSNYAYYFIISWLPYYLVTTRGFSYGSMASIAGWAYLLNASSAFAMGALSDQWIRRGASPTLIYKSTMAVAHLAGVACMIGMVSLPQSGSVACLFAFEAISGCSYPGLFAIPQILAGPRASGRWVGIQNAAGNVAGFIAPSVTGYLVQYSGDFQLAFVLSALISALGIVGWVVLLPRVEPQYPS